MPKYDVVFESQERILGVVPRADDYVVYECVLRVRSGGKTPVSLDMTFVPPHPYSVNMPEEYRIQATSVTAAYGKLVKFLGQYGVRFPV